MCGTQLLKILTDVGLLYLKDNKTFTHYVFMSLGEELTYNYSLPALVAFILANNVQFSLELFYGDLK